MFFINGFSSPFMIIMLILLIMENVGYYMNTPGAFLNLILSIPGLLVAITFHEFAHAFAADKLGDDTPRREGRLTLNPLKHLDPIGAILLLTAGFGWGKPVQINPNNFNRTISIRKGNAIVSLAGPLMNFVLAIVFSIIYGVILLCTKGMLSTNLIIVIEEIIGVNVALGVFNLIPLPPLDGSKILTAFLPTKARNWYVNHEYILYFVFVFLWITPLASSLITPAIRSINKWLTKLILFIVGLGT